jgi:hypothetical protein
LENGAAIFPRMGTFHHPFFQALENFQLGFPSLGKPDFFDI